MANQVSSDDAKPQKGTHQQVNTEHLSNDAGVRINAVDDAPRLGVVFDAEFVAMSPYLWHRSGGREGQ